MTAFEPLILMAKEGNMPDGKAVSIWECSECKITGTGIVYPDEHCLSGFDCKKPPGWELISRIIWCPDCVRKWGK